MSTYIYIYIYIYVYANPPPHELPYLRYTTRVGSSWGGGALPHIYIRKPKKWY